VSYGKILLSQADTTDRLLMGFGYFFSIAAGFGLPAQTFLLGDVINNFAGAKDLVDVMKPVVFLFVYIGLFIWVSSYFYYFLLVVLSERLGAKTKVAYLNAILQQEISWFDEINPTEFSVRLVKEC
jgi:ATP-binding cassette subfamily B (MDR/TAP) protein 1